jgi:hypothetical protein
MTDAVRIRLTTCGLSHSLPHLSHAFTFVLGSHSFPLGVWGVLNMVVGQTLSGSQLYHSIVL